LAFAKAIFLVNIGLMIHLFLVSQGRHEVVSLLLDRKANVEHRAKTGLTPLMEAASGGYTEVGRVLLDKGADVNAAPVPSSRDTALTIAADKGHYRSGHNYAQSPI
jgi:ankyrin repeat protein